MKVSFSATKGFQGGFTYYLANIPVSALMSSFTFEDTDLPIELRGQRERNQTRVNKFRQYMLENSQSYITGCLLACIDEKASFVEIDNPFVEGLGVLQIPADMKVLLADGQHRQGGIVEAAKNNPDFKTETVPVVFYYADAVERRQQIFTDSNAHGVKPSSSICIAFEHRSEFKNMIKDVLNRRPKIKALVDFESSSVGATSLKAWPLISFQKFVVRLLGLTEKKFQSDLNKAEDKEFFIETLTSIVVRFLDGLESLPYWSDMLNKSIKLKDLRQEYIVSHGVFLESLGYWGMQLFETFETNGEEDWEIMTRLACCDLSKNNFVGRCVTPQMTMVADSFGAQSTAAKICIDTNVELGKKLKEADRKVVAYSQESF